MTVLDPGHGLTEKTVVANGRRFRTVRAGVGDPTVVFESGLSAPAAEWVAVQRQVAARTATLSYDRAGYGGSDPADDGRRLMDLAADLESVLSATGVQGPVVLVGHSWGCPILRQFVQTTTRPLAGLVLVDGTIAAVMPSREARRARNAFAFLALTTRVGLGAPLMRAAMRRTKGVLSEADNAVILRDMSRSRSLRAAAAEADGLVAAVDSLPQLEAAGFPEATPVTFVLGELPDGGRVQMRQGFLSAARAEADRTGGRLVTSPTSSHFVPQQDPQLVVDEILALVTRAVRA